MAYEETLPSRQIEFKEPLAGPTFTGQVYKVSVDSELYAAKLFKPYKVDNDRLRLKRYNLSDDDLERRFHPWRRELRVYQHINNSLQGSKRAFFLAFYGTTRLSRSLCPHNWQHCDNTEDVPIIFLELLDKKVYKELDDLQISHLTRQTARQLFLDGTDLEYVHIYIYCMEKIEVLHDIGVIHGNIKADIFQNNASVVLDFSRSWSWEDEEPCLDSFRARQGPRSFKTRMDGERNWLQYLVIEEFEKGGNELRSRVPSWQRCLRCQQAMNGIISAIE